jgi:hypothetical protein
MTMGNLIAEKRVDKNGVLTTKHVKDTSSSKTTSSLLSRIVPGLDKNERRRVEMAKSLNSSVDAAFSNMILRISESNEQAAAQDPANADAIMGDSSVVIVALGESKRAALKSIKKFSADTLERIEDAAASGAHIDGGPLFEAIMYHGGSEVHLRESVTYLDEIGGRCDPHVLDHVRSSLGSDDLSDYPDRKAASAVYKVALKARENRFGSMSGIPLTQEEIEDFQREERDPNSDRQQMTPEIADVIVRNPERTDDIIAYLAQRNDIPTAVDVEALEDYLSAPAQSMAEGML